MQEAADELVGVERHRLVAAGSLDPVVLDLEGDAVLIEPRSDGGSRWRRGGCSATDRRAPPSGPANGRLA